MSRIPVWLQPVLFGLGILALLTVAFFVARHFGWTMALDDPRTIYITAFAPTFLALWLVNRLIARFQNLGQESQINKIKGDFSPDTKAEYFLRFWRGQDHFREAANDFKKKKAALSSQEDAAKTLLEDKFSGHVNELFGVDRISGANWMLVFTAGLVLYYAITSGMLLASDTSVHPRSYPFGIKPDIAIVAAVFGAYTWVASDVIYRNHLTDLSASDIYWYILRFIVAIPLGLALAQFSGFTAENSPTTPNPGAILAFVISMFSISRIQEILGGLTTRAFAIPAAAAATNEDVTLALPGVDQRTSDRLASEGVNTISQVAVADPVRLCARTGYSLKLVIDLIDRAMLWQFIGSKMLVTRLYGWLGASDVVVFAGLPVRLAAANQALAAAQAKLTNLQAATPIDPARVDEATAKVTAAQETVTRLTEESANASALVADIATKADLSVAGVNNLVATLAASPQARFTAQVKRDASVAP